MREILNTSSHGRRQLFLHWTFLALLAAAHVMGAAWVFWVVVFVAAATQWSLANLWDEADENIGLLEELMEGWGESTACVAILATENERLKDKLDAMSVAAPNNLLIIDRFNHDA